SVYIRVICGECEFRHILFPRITAYRLETVPPDTGLCPLRAAPATSSLLYFELLNLNNSTYTVSSCRNEGSGKRFSVHQRQPVHRPVLCHQLTESGIIRRANHLFLQLQAPDHSRFRSFGTDGNG